MLIGGFYNATLRQDLESNVAYRTSACEFVTMDNSSLRSLSY